MRAREQRIENERHIQYEIWNFFRERKDANEAVFRY